MIMKTLLLPLVLSVLLFNTTYAQEVEWSNISEIEAWGRVLANSNYDDYFFEISAAAEHSMLRVIDTTGVLVTEVNPCNCDTIELKYVTENSDDQILSIYNDGSIFSQVLEDDFEYIGSFIPDTINEHIVSMNLKRFGDKVYFYLNTNMNRVHTGAIIVDNLETSIATQTDTINNIYRSLAVNSTGDIVYLYHGVEGYTIRKMNANFEVLWTSTLSNGEYRDIAFSGENIIVTGRKFPGLNGVVVNVSSDGEILNELVIPPPSDAIVLEFFDLQVFNDHLYLSGYAQFSNIVLKSVFYVLNIPSLDIEYEWGIDFVENEHLILDGLIINSESIYYTGGISEDDSSEAMNTFTAKIAIDDVTSVDENQVQVNRFTLNPNPVSDGFWIEKGNGIDFRGKLSVFSSNGALIEEFNNISSGRIDVSDYPKGLYLIRISSLEEDFVQFEKIIKM